MTTYAELHALSNFTFLKGASHPEELVETAAQLGYAALAIRLESGLKLVVLAQNHAGYTQLCQLITNGRRAAEKGSYKLTADNFSDGLCDCLLLWVPGNQLQLEVADKWILDAFHKRLWIAVELLADGLHRQRISHLRSLGKALGLPLVASGDVHMHCRERRALQDTVTAIRTGLTLDRAGFALYPNGERYLR